MSVNKVRTWARLRIVRQFKTQLLLALMVGAAVGAAGFAAGPWLSAVASGMTTKAISKDLWLSEHTVKFHLTNIYRKLGVSNRSAAVRYAFENDLTSPLAAAAV